MLPFIQQFWIRIDNMRKMLYFVQDLRGKNSLRSSNSLKYRNRCSILKKLPDTPGTNVPRHQRA
ncbi:hypothetical protein R50912_04575 [Paenibacillus sp. FSL R5-0912]|nr:hypothetical protein R50912_04575 [Paenibacillus sp. FSL R5-0912]